MRVLSKVLLLTTRVAFGAALGATVDQEVFELAKNQNPLKLKVFLTHQPGHQIALAEKQVFQPEFDRLSQQVRELIQPFEIGKDIIPQAQASLLPTSQAPLRCSTITYLPGLRR